MFSQVLLKGLPQSVLAPWSAVLIAGFPKVWANLPRLLVDPFVLESRSFAPFRFRHDLARRPPMPRMNILNAVEQEAALLSSELRATSKRASAPFRRGPFIRGMLNTWSAGQASGWNRSNYMSMAISSRTRSACWVCGPLFSMTHSARSLMATSVISAREAIQSLERVSKT
jgi:hypothetical protein